MLQMLMHLQQEDGQTSPPGMPLRPFVHRAEPADGNKHAGNGRLLGLLGTTHSGLYQVSQPTFSGCMCCFACARFMPTAHSPRVMGTLYMRCRAVGPPPMALPALPAAMVSARDRDRALWGVMGAQSLEKLLRGMDALGDNSRGSADRREREELRRAMGSGEVGRSPASFCALCVCMCARAGSSGVRDVRLMD